MHARMTQSRNFKVGLVQMAMSTSPDENLRAAASWVEKAAKQGAQVVCLPELFRSPYFCQKEDAAIFDLAEPIPGPSTALLSDVAKKHGVAIVASLFERRAPGLYHNTAAILDADGGTCHLPADHTYAWPSHCQ